MGDGERPGQQQCEGKEKRKDSCILCIYKLHIVCAYEGLLLAPTNAVTVTVTLRIKLCIYKLHVYLL